METLTKGNSDMGSNMEEEFTPGSTDLNMKESGFKGKSKEGECTNKVMAVLMTENGNRT